MIKKLRRRFVLVALCSVSAVLVVIMCSINIASYLSVNRQADAVLSYLAENGGAFPKKPEGALPGLQPPGQGKEFDRRISEETPYETRFFTVSVASGEVTCVDTGFIAAIAREDAAAYALRVDASGRARGYVGSYRYLVSEKDGEKLIIFMDNSRALSAFRAFLYSSLLISAAGILAVLALAVLLSARAVRPVAESYEKQKRFITDAGHELKTPLAVISANTEVLELTEGESEWTRSIKNQVEKLSALTGSLIALSRMDEEGEKPQPESFDLSAAISECAESFRAPAEQRGRRLTVSVEPGISYHGRAEQIGRLAAILLDNAIKHAKGEGDISVALLKSGKNAVLRVQNPASGVGRGDHREYLERFYRADASRSSGGYGLGLSIAAAICEAHHARLTAISEDGDSLTVTAIL